VLGEERQPALRLAFGVPDLGRIDAFEPDMFLL
jgi:hypothetical protein